MSTEPARLDLAAIRAAREAIADVVTPTPLLRSTAFSELARADVYLKLETMQTIGSFKIRGAATRLARLRPAERARGVVTASAGNHAQGVALAARQNGAPATVFMPEATPLTKVSATKRLGASVRLVGTVWDESWEAAAAFSAERGATLVHPFDDLNVIAGQGTIGLELFEQLPDLEAVVVPVGGGGLLAGIATAIKALKPDVAVYGVQAAAAPATARSFRHGAVESAPCAPTIADGIRVARPGRLTFPIVKALAADVVEVSEEEISQSIVELLERSRLVVEGAGVVGLAALRFRRLPLDHKRIAVVLSGGNIDVNLMARIIEHGLARAGRFVVLNVRLTDRPGQLHALTGLLGEQRVNILHIEHHRAGWRVPVGEAIVTVQLETRDAEHGEQVIALLRAAGYEAWPAVESSGRQTIVDRP